MNNVYANELYKAARAVKYKGMTKQTTIPVLSHARLDVRDGRAQLVTVNLDDFEHPLHAEARARTMEPFQTCVPLKPFKDWLYATGDDLLDIQYQAPIATLFVKAGNTRAQFKCLDAQEFPAVDSRIPSEP